jgi:hypothetical protein
VKTGYNEESCFATKWFHFGSLSGSRSWYLPNISKYNLGISIEFQELIFQEVFCYDSKRTTSNSIDGFKPNLSHFSFWKSLHKKHVFRTFWGLSGGKRSKFYKRLCTRVSLQNAVHDKSHPETRTSRIESVLCDIVGERNSEHGFFELRWNLTIGQKEQESSRIG